MEMLLTVQHQACPAAAWKVTVTAGFTEKPVVKQPTQQRGIAVLVHIQDCTRSAPIWINNIHTTHVATFKLF